ncbi:hypothetical protein AAZX31_15G030300 [Glycine max]|uniref:Uncharacterized protein n=1 Tax=Glycine max TaxID=3847 RepID=K7M9A0_SOYBN|nr:hypothetical protein JHK86_041306 [Glycine max]KAG4955531.1 hypothetical protein JHK85_041911 [Glycine max]KAG5104271.1 hypothetical protein JHK82_041241 [Glycine max]KAG5115399.1 hypothetical protein JHK84_041512 [Glycine max]KAH1145296.1 hypothetical protein GYH30_041187 [Glycine max]
MSLTENATSCCMAPDEHIMTGHHSCKLRNQVDVICLRVSSDSNMKFWHSLSVEDKSYAVNSFHLFANVLVAFWLFLVASSYFLLSKNVNLSGGCRGKRAEKVSSSVRTISDATTENDATAANDTFSCSESFSSNNSWGELCTKCDAYYEISDFDKASYMHSLLSLEGEDSEWLADSMPCELSYENPSTPLSSYKCDAYHEISDFEQGSYMHSLLSLDDEGSEWLSDSKSFGCSSENPSTPLSYKCNAYFDISALEKASYMHSLLSLEDEDTQWLSDSKSSVRSFEEPSTPLSYKCDAYFEISDFDKASYMHSLLSLEDEDSEWLSDSKPYRCSSENPSTSISYKCDASEISDLDKASYIHSLLILEDENSEWLSDSKLFGGSISENPSTPISYKFDASSEISDFSKASYMHSLLSLEHEDSEWLSNSKPFGCSSESISTPLSYKCHASSVISDFSKASCMHSLLSLEDEDSAEWLSDSKSFGWSSENPSTPLSSKCDAFSDISDLDKSSYMHPSISIEDENSDWLSVSKSYGFSSENSTPLSYKFDAYNYEISDLDKASYLHSLLILEDEDSEWLSDSSSWSIVVPPSVSTSSSFTGVNCGNSEEEFSADEPLFWPFEGKLNWNSEEPWTSFCSSPRRRFDSRSTTSRIKGCNNKQKGNEALCIVNYETSRLSMWPKSSEKIVPLVCEDFYSNKDHLLGKEYSALCQELTIEALVGLKEFDGHEGLDSEFDQVFLMDQYLQ